MHHITADSNRVRKRISPAANIYRVIDAHTNASIAVETFPFRTLLYQGEMVAMVTRILCEVKQYMASRKL